MKSNQRTKSNKNVLLVLGILMLVFLFSVWRKEQSRKDSSYVTHGRVLKLHSGGTAGGFPVVHEKGNPSNAEILIFRDQYEKFNVAIPDSLVAVVEFMSECR